MSEEMKHGDIEEPIVICGLCKFARKSIHSSYYGGNGYHCGFGLIPSHCVLDEYGTCKNGEWKLPAPTNKKS